jgi:hypothetical protein
MDDNVRQWTTMYGNGRQWSSGHLSHIRKSRNSWAPKIKSEIALSMPANFNDELCASSSPKLISTELSLPYVGSQPSYPGSLSMQPIHSDTSYLRPHSILSIFPQHGLSAQSSDSRGSCLLLFINLTESSGPEAFDFEIKYLQIGEFYPKTVLKESPLME